MKTAYETIRAILIGFGSYQVLWLIYLYMQPEPDPNSLMHITMVGFTIEYYEFVIPVAAIAIAVRKYFPLDKPWLYDIYEGLTVSAIYVVGIFGLHMLNLIFGWLVSGKWKNEYFNYLPRAEPMTVFAILAIPAVILCVRNLIDKPFLRRFGNRLGLK